jgi:hypothetical protein
MINRNNANLTDKARAFLAKDPTHIGTVLGVDYFEHPTLGDESPLIEIGADGKLKLSDWWELPSVNEVLG